MKRSTDLIIVGFLVAIFVSTVLIQVRLSNIRDIIKESETPKLEITNNYQFTKLCKQFTSQWGANGYAFYLLQPKSSSKTHKEKASSSIEYDRLPVRVELTDDYHKRQMILYKFIIGDSELASKLIHTSFVDCKNFLLIPIYQNDIIIGELYLFYNHDFKDTSIMHKVSEAQLLGKLLN